MVERKEWSPTVLQVRLETSEPQFFPDDLMDKRAGESLLCGGVWGLKDRRRRRFKRLLVWRESELVLGGEHWGWMETLTNYLVS